MLVAVTLPTPVPRPPLTVTIQDFSLTDFDIGQMTVLMIDGSAFLSKAIPKSRGEMPGSSRYFYYAGKDARGIPITWRTAEALPRVGTARNEEIRESEAVAVIAVLDSGIDPNVFADQRKPTIERLHPLYAKNARDLTQLNALGLALADAVKQMSDLTVARQAEDNKWVSAEVKPSMTRAEVYDALRERGLAATTQDEHTNFPESGSAIVTLPGAFEPGCYFSTKIALSFDSNDRLTKTSIRDVPDCL